jgi:AraC-like DNA-binding protein
MDNPPDQHRIKQIYQLLFEMTTGNHTLRMPQGDKEDELDKLIKIINDVAERMHLIILNLGFVNPHYSYQNLVQTTFILDEDFIIISFSSDLPLAFGYEPEQIFKMDFHVLLAIQFQPFWDTIKNQIKSKKNYYATMQILFITAQKKIIPSYCSISRLLYSNKILISTISTIIRDIDTLNQNKNTKNTIASRNSEAIIIQNLYDYILNNLEEPLPNVKILSKMFGTNEFALKDGFRHFFKTSIYHFYTEERLKKAHLLIQQTAIPLKEIAFMSGFTDYINFYKSFKKRYSYPPSAVKRDTGL